MKLKQRKSGWLYFGVMFLFFVAAFASIDISFERSIRRHFRIAVYSLTAKIFDLAEPVSYGEFAKILIKLPGAMLNGDFPAPFEDLKIEVKYKHFDKMKMERDRAMFEGALHNQGTYPAEIMYNGEQYVASVRLKGNLSDHRDGADRWSLRVKLKDGKTIRGFKQFSLHKPKSRQAPADHLFQHWMRSAGNLAPKHDYLRIQFNGDDWGIMDVEEHMSKQFLELSERKEGPIVNFGSETSYVWYMRANQNNETRPPGAYYGPVDMKLYGVSAIVNDPAFQKLYSYGVSSFRRYNNGMLPLDDLIDINSYSRALFGAVAWQKIHTLNPGNTKAYLNPYTLRFETVTTDQDYINTFDASAMHLPPIYRSLATSPNFEKNFKENMAQVDRARASVKDEYVQLCKKFPLQCPKFDMELFQNNFDQMKALGPSFFIQEASKPNPVKTLSTPKTTKAETYPLDIKIPRHITAEYYTDGTLDIYNLLIGPTELVSVKIHCKKKKDCKPVSLLEGPVTLPFGMMEDQLPARISIPVSPDLLAKKHRASGILGKNRYIKIVSRAPGGEEKLSEKIRLSMTREVMNPLLDKVATIAELNNLEYVSIENNTISIAPGSWTILKPLVLPRDMSLTVDAGATLQFMPNAYLIVQGAALNIGGTAENPVRMTGVGGNAWKGIYILEAPSVSRLSHVTFENTDFLRDGVLMLTGGVTFYRSDVKLDQVSFIGSQAEDGLNIVHSDFDIRGSLFSGMRSDAFDSDFSTGEIIATWFNNIGGDGFDTSGSSVNVMDVEFDEIIDKAISIGENSNVVISDARINNVGTGIVSKDGSRVIANNINVNDFELFAGMTYNKKSIYGNAEMRIDGSNFGSEAVISQSGNALFLNETLIKGQNIDVDALYAAGSMKKVTFPQ